MGIKVKEPIDIIHPSKLKPGQIGIIVSWGSEEETSKYVGTIVQLHQQIDQWTALVGIGEPERNWVFLDIGQMVDRLSGRCKVRVLQKGEILEIV